MQAMWGNEVILRLHNELNNVPKETIVVNAPRYWDYNPDFMNDYIQNFDKLEFFIPIMIIMIIFIRSQFIDVKTLIKPKKPEIKEE